MMRPLLTRWAACFSKMKAFVVFVDASTLGGAATTWDVLSSAIQITFIAIINYFLFFLLFGGVRDEQRNHAHLFEFINFQ